MFAHLAWADLRAWQSLGQAGAPPAHAVELYAHIVGAERVWLDRLHGRPQSVAVWPKLDVAAAGQLGKETRGLYEEYLRRLTVEDVDRSVTYVNSAGDQFTSSVRDILIHVALHGTYHRGQIALLLREGGQLPAPTDYIAFVRGAPAATRQP